MFRIFSKRFWRFIIVLAIGLNAGCVSSSPVRESAAAQVQPQVPDWQRTCADLYNEYVYLLPASYDTRKDFWDNPLNQLAGAVGTIFPPAFAVWGYTGAQKYMAGRDIDRTNQRITALQQTLAQKQCFVR